MKTRLVQLLNKLNPELLANYDEIIKTYEKENIEKIETVGKPGLMHYLPHHAVIKNERDTTKTRIVFDTSKVGNNPSLNDCLHSGHCLLPLIFDIFMRFRIGDVDLVEDIKQAFLTCKKVQGKVLRPPPTPALPEYRVCAEFPFQVTGFDFAGPLFVKDIYSKSSDVNKCFILIFTCAPS